MSDNEKEEAFFVISRLLDIFEEVAPEAYFSSDLVAQADDLLKKLER